MGSAQSARGTQPGGSWYGGSVSCGSSSRRPPPLSSPAPVGRIFSAVVRRDRLWVGLEEFGGEGGRRLDRLWLYSTLCSDLVASWGRGRSTSLCLPPPTRGGDGAPSPPA